MSSEQNPKDRGGDIDGPTKLGDLLLPKAVSIAGILKPTIANLDTAHIVREL